jgi:hypothetical protein
MSKTYILTKTEFEAICALEGPQRYEHFIKRVADWESVWGLRDEEGWVAAGDDEGNSGFPVWPHPDFAAACAIEEWADNQPAPIDVHEFVEDWLPNMAEENVTIAVFPTPALRGVMVSASELQEHLLAELSNYE